VFYGGTIEMHKGTINVYSIRPQAAAGQFLGRPNTNCGLISA